MVRHQRRPADRAEQNRIQRPQHVEKIVRHDFAVLLPVLHAPGQVRVFEREAAVELLHSIEHADRFAGDFDARCRRRGK